MEPVQHKEALNHSYSEFEDAYISLRKSEGRLFSDYEVLLLPDVSEAHPYFKEWQIRKRSAKRLFRYLENLNRPLSILDVGCGNGWFSALLSRIHNSNITAIDINKAELNQAKKLFSGLTNIRFLEASIDDIEVVDFKYDVIIFASSIQYFASLQSTIQQCLHLLNNSGEIHIIDTHFYSASEVATARKRSLEYFSKAGHQKMSEYYYHHGIEELKLFKTKILEGSDTLFRKLSAIKNPFYWVRIKHD